MSPLKLFLVCTASCSGRKNLKPIRHLHLFCTLLQSISGTTITVIELVTIAQGGKEREDSRFKVHQNMECIVLRI